MHLIFFSSFFCLCSLFFNRFFHFFLFYFVNLSWYVKIILCLSHLNNYHKAEANPPKLKQKQLKLELSQLIKVNFAFLNIDESEQEVGNIFWMKALTFNGTNFSGYWPLLENLEMKLLSHFHFF